MASPVSTPLKSNPSRDATTLDQHHLTRHSNRVWMSDSGSDPLSAVVIFRTNAPLTLAIPSSNCFMRNAPKQNEYAAHKISRTF
ncbi:hypothetical protein VNO78_22059 [Psophocarpus tetragonolobus]|uniref:Uncharacterized protein n=1 Tax=Psophocarpus tetragonolobus TaxID=3891 RepID=A0AAN9XIQ1_PSOTE